MVLCGYASVNHARFSGHVCPVLKPVTKVIPMYQQNQVNHRLVRQFGRLRYTASQLARIYRRIFEHAQKEQGLPVQAQAYQWTEVTRHRASTGRALLAVNEAFKHVSP